jgi:transposase
MKRKTNKGGRPTSYNAKIHPLLVKALAQLGKTNKEISKEMGISEKTLDNWKVKYPEFLRAIKKGKSSIDDMVENALLKNALGYEYEEEKAFVIKGKIKTVMLRKHSQKNTGAEIFWLKNRRPERWREKQEVEIKGEIVDIVKGIFDKKDKKIVE